MSKAPSIVALVSVTSLLALAGSAHADVIYGLTTSNSLVSFNSANPLSVSSPVAIGGLQSGETLLGIDFRPANSQLYGLGSSGRLYVINTGSGAAAQVGSGTFAVPLTGQRFGFNFNPQVDRIRVTSDSGQNLRLHPDLGSVVDGNTGLAGVQGDTNLAFVAGDANFGVAPRVVASSYTNNRAGTTSTTMFNIDGRDMLLVRQGSAAGTTPLVSPNLGNLTTIGSLLVDPTAPVGFDIASSDGTAFLSLNIDGFPNSSLYTINLTTGAASFVSAIDGPQLSAIAVAIPSPSGAVALGLAGLIAARRRRTR